MEESFTDGSCRDSVTDDKSPDVKEVLEWSEPAPHLLEVPAPFELNKETPVTLCEPGEDNAE